MSQFLFLDFYGQMPVCSTRDSYSGAHTSQEPATPGMNHATSTARGGRRVRPARPPKPSLFAGEVRTYGKQGSLFTKQAACQKLHVIANNY